MAASAVYNDVLKPAAKPLLQNAAHAAMNAISNPEMLAAAGMHHNRHHGIHGGLLMNSLGAGESGGSNNLGGRMHKSRLLKS